ncbi:MAG: metal-dependent hydrolase [Nodosilinea sp.]
MMSVTHAALAIAATAISIGTADPYVLTTAAIASQLPDIDTTESFSGRLIWPLTNFLEQRFPHRSLTHSFMATGIVAGLAAPLLWIQWQLFLAIVLGYFVGWFADAFTKSGVEAFYPNPARLVIPGNPRARLDTRSPAEYWVLATAVFLTIISINLTSAGGLSETVARTFFNDTATAADLFHKHGATQRVFVTVEGIHTYTRQSVSGTYEVLEASTSDVIAENVATSQIYKIGKGSDAQIRPNRVKVNLGDPVSVTAQMFNLQEVGVTEWLATVPQNAYISGSLMLDDMDEAPPPSSLETYPTIRLSTGQIELQNAHPQEISALLREFWILQGSVLVKIKV